MTTNPEATESNTPEAYRSKVGLVAEIPNFPGLWEEARDIK